MSPGRDTSASAIVHPLGRKDGERRMTDLLVAWLVRWGHVLAAAIWVGGYALLAFVIVPGLAKRPAEASVALAITCIRVMSFAGTATIVFGLLLIWRTRGFGSLLGGEWGGIVLTSLVLAVVMLGIGDSGLRPALRRLPESGSAAPARRLAIILFVIVVIAVALMTRAPYARP
jgi:putative copper export protein